MTKYPSVSVDRAGIDINIFDTTRMADGVENGPVLHRVLILSWPDVVELVETHPDTIDLDTGDQDPRVLARRLHDSVIVEETMKPVCDELLMLKNEVTELREHRDDLIAALAIAQSAASALAYTYDQGTMPPLDAVEYGRSLPVQLPRLPVKP